MAGRLASGGRLVLASHNPGKLAEIAELMRPYGVTVVSAAELGLAEPDETAADFVGNARIKALAAARGSGLPALADDSGFCLAALGGAPGVHSARWAGPERDFAAAMARVNDEAGNNPDRRAWFVCALCLGWPDGETETFVGRVDGRAVWPARGERGFGYDPMFVPQGGAETYGEMDPAQKHATSHRARAFDQLAAHLELGPDTSKELRNDQDELDASTKGEYSRTGKAPKSSNRWRWSLCDRCAAPKSQEGALKIRDGHSTWKGEA